MLLRVSPIRCTCKRASGAVFHIFSPPFRRLSQRPSAEELEQRNILQGETVSRFFPPKPSQCENNAEHLTHTHARTARYHMTHGPVLVHGSGLGDHCSNTLALQQNFHFVGDSNEVFFQILFAGFSSFAATPLTPVLPFVFFRARL